MYFIIWHDWDGTKIERIESLVEYNKKLADIREKQNSKDHYGTAIDALIEGQETDGPDW
jgi:hypothetical protein